LGLTVRVVARRSTFSSVLREMQCERERQARAQERAAAAAIRASEQARRALERAQAWEEKERKRLYLEARQAEVEAMNEALAADVATLESLLRQTLDVDDYLDFEALKQTPVIPPFRPGDLATSEVAPELILPPPLSGVAKLVPGAKAKYERAVEAARASHQAEIEAYALREKGRETALSHAHADHESEVARLEAGCCRPKPRGR
jgi:restriction system protein